MSALAEKQHVVSKVAARKSGASVTFTLTNPGTYDSTTNTWSGASTSTVVGVGRRIPGDPVKYQTLNLVESESPTLEFVPDTYGESPALLSACTWSSTTYVVRDVQPWAPDGNTISCRVVVSRGGP